MFRFRRLFSNVPHTKTEFLSTLNVRTLGIGSLIGCSMGVGIGGFLMYHWNTKRSISQPTFTEPVLSATFNETPYHYTCAVQKIIARRPDVAVCLPNGKQLEEAIKELTVLKSATFNIEDNVPLNVCIKTQKSLRERDINDVYPPNPALLPRPGDEFGDDAITLDSITSQTVVALLSVRLYKTLRNLFKETKYGLWMFVYPSIDDNNTVTAINAIIEKTEADLLCKIGEKGFSQTRDGYLNCIGYEYAAFDTM